MSEEVAKADSVLALERTVEAAMATLGVSVVPDAWPTDQTIRPHEARDVQVAETREEVADTRGASCSGTLSEAQNDRSLGPASMSVSGLPVLSVIRGEGPSDAADIDLQIVSLLGEGGMGRVELARQRSLRREVAVKSLRNPSPRRRDALLREALFTGYLEHPNIVPVHQLGQVESGPVLVMKRVAGVSWRELIAEPTHPYWQHRTGDRLVQHLQVLQQVCNAVDFAHSRGIVHRDIKPENVMLGEFGEVYLMDWGIAIDIDGRGEPSNALVGTPAYLAPEMLDGDAQVGPWTDVYLLGACLFEVLTGTVPHRGEGLRQTLVAAFQSNIGPFPDDAPEELATLVRTAMTREITERQAAFPSAGALRVALGEFQRSQTAREFAQRAQESLDRALESDEKEQRTALAEARFGFFEALRVVPGSPEARAGLQATLTILIQRELSAENHGLASALLDELPTPDPELEKELDKLASALAADRGKVAEFDELRRDVDVRVGSRARGRFFVVVAAVFATFTAVAYGLQVQGLATRTAVGQTLSALVVAILISGALVLGWKRLSANRVSRQLVWMQALLPWAVVANRAHGWANGVALDVVLVSDLVLIACFTALSAVLDRRLVWLLPVALAGPIVGTLLLEHALLVLGAVLSLLALVLRYVWRNDPR